jgi:hypothetical protein
MMYRNIVLSSSSKKKLVLPHVSISLGLAFMQDNTEGISLIETVENRAIEVQNMLEVEYPTHSCEVFVTRKPTAGDTEGSSL